MSGAKFASITASLLARKGEAQPWNQAGPPLALAEAGSEARPERAERAVEARVEAEISYPWRHREAHGAPPPPPPPAKEKSCMLRMSAHDFERLGILAIKTGSSRAQLLKDAVQEFLANRADEYGCSCLGACENDCGNL
ncbi:MAG TPA: hypothetical protein VFI23_04460 [Rhizomicrobium sp.]|nr:hypothetical protein [Rhizomicrobium sp.]